MLTDGAEMMASVEADDKYSTAIEVSNACRMFYVSRLQTAETLKDRLVDRRRAVRAAAASSPLRGADRPSHTVDDDTAALESVVAQLHKELVSQAEIYKVEIVITSTKHTTDQEL